MEEITIRPQRVSDAKRFFEILKNPNFKHFAVNVKSVKQEIKFLRQNASKRRKNIAYNYAILYKGKVVGGCGIKINQHRPFIGETGYFIDEPYWDKGIATKAVKILEKIGFGKLKLKRIEILMNPPNKASEKVARKCGYRKEGLMKKAVKQRGRFNDVYLYAKVR